MRKTFKCKMKFGNVSQIVVISVEGSKGVLDSFERKLMNTYEEVEEVKT